MREVTTKEVRTILVGQTPGFGVPGDFTINPYRGCIFGCSYCYATKFVHDDEVKKQTWGEWVEVKRNAVDALMRDSHKLPGKSVFIASATDPYQPVELRLGLTRALLEVLLFSFPAHVHIQTRSPFVTRDIDLLKKFGDTLEVGISLPTDSDIVRKAFEPQAPAIHRRVAAAKQLRAAGIRTSASIAPLLPCTPDRIARIVAGSFDSAWVGRLTFYDKEERLRSIYAQHGWTHFLDSTHRDRVREAVHAALERRKRESGRPLCAARSRRAA